jgi:hypothetical protein
MVLAYLMFSTLWVKETITYGILLVCIFIAEMRVIGSICVTEDEWDDKFVGWC